MLEVDQEERKFELPIEESKLEIATLVYITLDNAPLNNWKMESLSLVFKIK